MSINFLLSAIGLYAIVFVYYLVKAARKRGVSGIKYELKKAANSWRLSIHLIWTMYFVIWGVLQMPEISSWSTAQMAAHPEFDSGTLTYYIYAAPPYMWVITILAVSWWFVALSSRPWIEYSEQEQEWLEEEKARLREQLQKYLGKRVGAFLIKLRRYTRQEPSIRTG